MGLLGVARANTAVGVIPETFLLLLGTATTTGVTRVEGRSAFKSSMHIISS
jgi:hypothetical protein